MVVAWTAVQVAHNTAVAVVHSPAVRSLVDHSLPVVAVVAHSPAARSPVGHTLVVHNPLAAIVRSLPAVAVVRNPAVHILFAAVIAPAVHNTAAVPVVVAAPIVAAAPVVVAESVAVAVLVLSAVPVVYTPSAALPAPAHMVPIVV